MTRADIAEHVWDERYDPFSNLIEVYVQRLRRKLTARNSAELIHTRRGQGYVFSTKDLNPTVHLSGYSIYSVIHGIGA